MFSYCTYSVCPHIGDQLQSTCSIVWRATGFGPWTDPVCSIYCRCTPACERPWSCASRLCRRHSDSRHLPSFGDCLDAVASWMAANRLQLNNSKTDALWCSSTRRQHQTPTRPVRVGGTSVQPVVVVRNLGIQFDADVTMRSHVTATVCSCFATLRQISSIRHSVASSLADLNSSTCHQQA